MASSSQGLRIGIQILLGIVIVALAYFLYLSITGPWQRIEQERALRAQTQVQMLKVRDALVAFERQQDRFPSTLDSLSLWLKTDSLMQVDGDSLFGPRFNPDSIYYSPKTRKRFLYTLNDTGRVAIYLLKDPDSEDQIGSETPDVTRLNAASWQ